MIKTFESWLWSSTPSGKVLLNRSWCRPILSVGEKVVKTFFTFRHTFKFVWINIFVFGAVIHFLGIFLLQEKVSKRSLRVDFIRFNKHDWNWKVFTGSWAKVKRTKNAFDWQIWRRLHTSVVKELRLDGCVMCSSPRQHTSHRIRVQTFTFFSTSHSSGISVVSSTCSSTRGFSCHCSFWYWISKRYEDMQ